MRGRGDPEILLGYQRDPHPQLLPTLSQPCAPPPTPTAQPCSQTHLGRWALQGVAVQQNDLQVPEAAEGDRDAGDTVTGEIQADKRKVPQLWGWVREKSDACSGRGHVLTSSAPCSGWHVTSPAAPSALVGGGHPPGTTALLLCPLKLTSAAAHPLLLPAHSTPLPLPPPQVSITGPKSNCDTLLLKSHSGLAARAASGKRVVPCTKAQASEGCNPQVLY